MTINTPVRAPRHRRAWRVPALSLLLLVLAVGVMLYFVRLNTLVNLVARQSLMACGRITLQAAGAIRDRARL